MAQSTAEKEKTLKLPKRGSRAWVKAILNSAFRKKFPHDTVDISDGYDGDIHVLVVSRVFDKMRERTRYAYLWKIIESTTLTSAEKDMVTVVVGVSPTELK